MHTPPTNSSHCKLTPDVSKLLDWHGANPRADVGQYFPGLNSIQIMSRAIEVRRSAGIRCNKKVDALVDSLERLYLRSFGLKVDGYTHSEVKRAFSAFILPDEKYKPYYTMALESRGYLENPPSIEKLLDVFGTHATLDGVLIQSFKEGQIELLDSILKKMCPEKACAFWDKGVLYKVLLTSQSGLAAFLPEVGVLILSHGAFASPRLLHNIVIAHELTHVAELSYELRENRNLRDEFALFSNWQKTVGSGWETKVVLGAMRTDPVHKESLKSDFGFGEKDHLTLVDLPFDGFVTERSYHESVSHGPSEDLADHVAFYTYYPKRFCDGGRNIAPKKFDWIRRILFSESRETLTCSKGLK